MYKLYNIVQYIITYILYIVVVVVLFEQLVTMTIAL